MSRKSVCSMSLSSWVIFRYCLILGSIGIAQCHRRLPTHDAIFTDRVTFHSFNSNGWVQSSSFKSSKSVFSDIGSLGCRGGADWDVTPEENDDDDTIANETPELETETVDEENDIDEESDEEPNPVAATTKPPVKLVIKTGLNNQLIDQSLELMASRTRDVASLKLSCFRQMRGRPPVELQTIRLGMAALDDHMTIDDILGDDEDDDDDEDEEDADEPTLVLTLDIAPPVDPKFGTELGELVKSKTTGELIEAYAANQACLMGISKLIAGSSSSNIDQVVEGETEEEVDIAEESPSKSNPVLESETLWMRKQASIVKEQLLSTMSEDALKMLDKTDEEEESSDALLVSSIRKSRRGGARMNMKRVLQRNLNIDWGTTIRNFLLFLFFGFFGARDALSRTLMYLGAPMCFVIQARPVKILIKQVFYGVGTPPGILLSLLSAPQQKIMDLDFKSAMEDLYGSPSNRSLKEGAEADEDVEESEYDDEYDEYDE